MTRSGRTPTLAEIAVANLRRAGRSRTRAMIEAAQACSLIWAWAKTTRDLGHEPTRFEHAQHWHQTERSAYRDLARFRAAFPTEKDPQNLANWLSAQQAELVNEGAVMGLAAPPGLVIV